MNKTTEALKLAEEALIMSQQHIDLHTPEYVVTRKINEEALAAIREALADHNPDATKMVAEPVQEQVNIFTCSVCGASQEVYIVAKPKCNPHPDAPHGFDRNASHSADRYVCECEGWEPPKQEPATYKPYTVKLPTFMVGRNWHSEEIQRWLDELPPLYVGPVRAEPVKQDTPYCKSVPMCAKPCGDESCVEPVKQEPIARVTGYYAGRCVIEPLNRASVFPTNMALYAAPVEPLLKDNPFLAEQLQAYIDIARAEALEEAAKVCEKAMIQMNYSEAPYKQCAAAIRSIK